MRYWSFFKYLKSHSSKKIITTCGTGLLAFVALNDRSQKKTEFDIAVENSRDLLQRVKDECGCPGIIAAVGIDGKLIWSQGLGYADVENRVECTPNTVMRIASISKSITMALAGKLREQGILDYDAPIQEYIKIWPEKYFQGKPVKITTRQLVSHLGGIRHYSKCNEKTTDNNLISKEYYNKRNYKTTKESLSLFLDDEICSLPGTQYLYSTYGWTLISAVLEGASSKSFDCMIKDLFQTLNLKSTYLDLNDAITYHRAR